MAASYFEDRIDVAAWVSASDPQKSQALVTASQMLNDIRWIGQSTSAQQLLAFPRVGVYYDTMLEANVALDPLVVPNRIKQATYELAYHLLNNDGLLDMASTVANLQVGKIKIEGIIAAPKFPARVRSLFAPLEATPGSSRASWWRAN